MPRAALILAAALVAALLVPASSSAATGAPHVDPRTVPASCAACHAGHGLSRSPMLEQPQVATCLACHSTKGELDQAVRDGKVAPDANPPLLATVLTQPYLHPMDRQAFSADGADAVVCTSCHSPHRGMPAGSAASQPTGERYLSPRDPHEFESELCEDCHGNKGAATSDRTDISRLLDLSSRSFHPVHGPSGESSPSVVPKLAGRAINCSDCHGTDDATAPPGPHGSGVRYILRKNFVVDDGSEKAEQAYALCFSCHDPEKVMSPTGPFPGHALHVRSVHASCASCHNPHGSVANRALVRFGEDTGKTVAIPSPSTGRLGFESTAAGSGTCWLSCHGVDHGPMSYGPTRTDRPTKDRLRHGQRKEAAAPGDSRAH